MEGKKEKGKNIQKVICHQKRTNIQETSIRVIESQACAPASCKVNFWDRLYRTSFFTAGNLKHIFTFSELSTQLMLFELLNVYVHVNKATSSSMHQNNKRASDCIKAWAKRLPCQCAYKPGSVCLLIIVWTEACNHSGCRRGTYTGQYISTKI